ncbi:cell wall hydrolase [Qipengyuania sp. DY56-A-20]|jgi:spore germination cell wall hydrolase CwlJ-like protein|uniref:Cell wall hydrolase n=1 Tax=Qipengyuania benthica TaxID=3067651 RepID=A0ABT9H8Q8_9SPHN|nr:cell wall hydrolase [Qipengyuania sp. DY56-A-20]MDP4539707.1 cell wall hydrolase [Qipengyuania sp. DY56-A-20]
MTDTGAVPGSDPREPARLSASGSGPHSLRDADEAARRGAERVARRAASRRRRTAHSSLLRRRFAAVGALTIAVAVPALAAPLGLDDLTARAFGVGSESAPLAAMPFERADTNFPGSAFYYLDGVPGDVSGQGYDLDDLRSPEAVQGDTIRFAQSHDPGLAARAFQSAGSAVDRARALQCLSMAVYYEAASESYDGQRAVAQVVLNRVAHPAYPASVCGVVFQGSERRTGCQFTFTCDGSLARQPARASWATAQSVALSALSGQVFAAVGTATHYHTHAVNPYWAPSLDLIGSIGAHRFYRWKGRAGQVDAFTMSYRGGEPFAAPRPRTAESAEPVASGTPDTPAPRSFATPPAPNEAFSAPPGNGPVEPARAPRVDDRLPDGGTVKAEYRRSGQWIAQPGKAPAAR